MRQVYYYIVHANNSQIYSIFMKQIRKHKQLIKQKQKMYVNNWNMAEGLKFYDALDDEYSTYYFANPTVKKHLKHFSKVAKKQPKTVDLLRMTFLLQNKYRKKSKGKQDHSMNKGDESISNSIIQSYKEGLKPQSLQKLKKIKNYHLEPESEDKSVDKKYGRAESCQEGLPKVKNAKVYKSRDEDPKAVPVRRKDYLQYIQNKKEQIDKNNDQ